MNCINLKKKGHDINIEKSEPFQADISLVPVMFVLLLTFVNVNYCKKCNKPQGSKWVEKKGLLVRKLQ